MNRDEILYNEATLEVLRSRRDTREPGNQIERALIDMAIAKVAGKLPSRPDDMDELFSNEDEAKVVLENTESSDVVEVAVETMIRDAADWSDVGDEVQS